MTNKTYNQLWWDEEFVEKRIQEQKTYLKSIKPDVIKGLARPYWLPKDEKWVPGPVYFGRKHDLRVSALAVLRRFKRQLEEIQKLKRHCCRY